MAPRTALSGSSQTGRIASHLSSVSSGLKMQRLVSFSPGVPCTVCLISATRQNSRGFQRGHTNTHTHTHRVREREREREMYQRSCRRTVGMINKHLFSKAICIQISGLQRHQAIFYPTRQCDMSHQHIKGRSCPSIEVIFTDDTYIERLRLDFVSRKFDQTRLILDTRPCLVSYTVFYNCTFN